MARPAFLDRFIPRPADAPTTRAPVDTLSLVIRNLEAILNTKEGYGYFLPGFGLGGYTARSGTADLIETLNAEIEATIRRYEPRLTEPELIMLGRDAGLQLLYTLKGKIEGEQHTLLIRFDTIGAVVRVEEKK